MLPKALGHVLGISFDFLAFVVQFGWDIFCGCRGNPLFGLLKGGCKALGRHVLTVVDYFEHAPDFIKDSLTIGFCCRICQGGQKSQVANQMGNAKLY